jgi:hypothetical protein
VSYLKVISSVRTYDSGRQKEKAHRNREASVGIAVFGYESDP